MNFLPTKKWKLLVEVQQLMNSLQQLKGISCLDSNVFPKVWVWCGLVWPILLTIFVNAISQFNFTLLIFFLLLFFSWLYWCFVKRKSFQILTKIGSLPQTNIWFVELSITLFDRNQFEQFFCAAFNVTDKSVK